MSVNGRVSTAIHLAREAGKYRPVRLARLRQYKRGSSSHWARATEKQISCHVPIGPAVRADFRRLYPANAKTPTCCPSDDNRTKVTNSVTSARSLWWHVGPYFWPADLTRTANPIDLLGVKTTSAKAARNLGVILYSSFRSHVSAVCRSCRYHM